MFSKTYNQYTFRPVTLILAKNLVGKQFGKGFFESRKADFENFKEGDKKIPSGFAECKGADLVDIVTNN
jgi:isoleucyl-tRNA synthetase